MAKNKFTFIIGAQFELENTSPSLNQQFASLYNSFFSGKAFDEGKFKTCAHEFFNTNKGNTEAHDAFFNNFTILTERCFLPAGKIGEIEKVWSFALQIAYDWEEANSGERIHKGTPYHFLGITYLLLGDLVKGFLHIHQALEEDKKTQNKICPHTPGYYFVTLNYNKAVYGQGLLKTIADYLDGKIVQYRQSTSNSLIIEQFKQKFLDREVIVDLVFSFAYAIFNLHKLEKAVNRAFVQNDFASLLESNLIFDLCLITDSVIKLLDNKKYFIEHFDYMASRSFLNLNSKKAGEANQRFKADFKSTLSDLLQGTFSFSDRSQPDRMATDFLITYGFRNHSAHSIESKKIVYENFPNIIQRVLNSLFLSVEKFDKS